MQHPVLPSGPLARDGCAWEATGRCCSLLAAGQPFLPDQLEATIANRLLALSTRPCPPIHTNPEQTANATWKRGRNQHARLLLEQLRAGVLEAPFHQMPPCGPLPTLPLFLTARCGPASWPPAGRDPVTPALLLRRFPRAWLPAWLAAVEQAPSPCTNKASTALTQRILPPARRRTAAAYAHWCCCRFLAPRRRASPASAPRASPARAGHGLERRWVCACRRPEW
jgi:hypothetical protein